MTDDTIITKSTSELIKARMNGEELESFVRKAREQQLYDYATSRLGLDPEIYGTNADHKDQFELYLNMYPEVRKAIEEEARSNGWQATGRFGPDVLKYDSSLAYKNAWTKAYKKWVDENEKTLRKEQSKAEDKKYKTHYIPAPSGGMQSRPYDDQGNSYVPGGGYRVTPDGRRI